ncbi:MAG: mannose-1-phosphate guanylyltransferase [Candidatus Cloacimonetes bacterium]|nr:mannose-1-phosphate guanylyltransferase [Candidatus Cloacimonadota bacterium]
MIALIMAGGSGKRFWPLSRRDLPKQYLKIISDRSLIQMTYDRLLPVFSPHDIYVITSVSQKHLIKEHLPELPEANIILEPCARNTAPCIGLSSIFLRGIRHSSENMLVLPSDHYISDSSLFFSSIQLAEKVSREGYLVTFGIKPTYPATGFGYIESGEEILAGSRKVIQFKEKPVLKDALEFINRGNFFWNSGMFMWSISSILDAIADHMPDLFKALEIISGRWKNEGVNIDFSQEYSLLPHIPIDIGVMEKASNKAVIPVSYGWSDLGSWQTLYNMKEHDKEGNFFSGLSATINSKGNLVIAGKLVSLIDIDDLIIIDTGDILLITPRNSSEKVKRMVDKLEKEGREKEI